MMPNTTLTSRGNQRGAEADLQRQQRAPVEAIGEKVGQPRAARLRTSAASGIRTISVR